MHGNARSTPSPGESGSTLLEVIVALAIISVLGIGAWNGVGAAIRIASRIRETAVENAHILQLDDELRGLAGRVRAPFWAPGQSLVVGDRLLHVSNLDGDPDKAFSLSFQDGVLEVDDGGRVLRFSDFVSAAFSAAEEESGTYGLTLELSTEEGRTIEITARFGSMPIQERVGP